MKPLCQIRYCPGAAGDKELSTRTFASRKLRVQKCFLDHAEVGVAEYG